MPECPATLVVVPRERFSAAERSLESIYANTEGDFRLIYVDGGSPEPVRAYLAAAARRFGFEWLRSEEYLSPNRARNIGFARVETSYAVFLDNDVEVRPGWLEALVRCADETGADVVGPLTFVGEFDDLRVHMAGGDLALETRADGLHLAETHALANQTLRRARAKLARRPCDFAEFHGMLVRSEALRREGGLDEGLLAHSEHLDLCLALRRRGREVWFEPASELSYLAFQQPRVFDVPYFHLRWSDDWNQRSVERFAAKWQLAESSGFARSSLKWARRHQQKLGLMPRAPRPGAGEGEPCRDPAALLRRVEAADAPAFEAEAARHACALAADVFAPEALRLACAAAGLLHDFGAPMSLTLAGLLAGLYDDGVVSGHRLGAGRFDRRVLQRVLGAEIESLVSDQARWDRAAAGLPRRAEEVPTCELRLAKGLLLVMARSLARLRCDGALDPRSEEPATRRALELAPDFSAWIGFGALAEAHARAVAAARAAGRPLAPPARPPASGWGGLAGRLRVLGWAPQRRVRLR